MAPEGKDASLTLAELYSDLNNDGKLNGEDGALIGKPYASGATDAEKEQGTEFMFANDNLSNGAWDKDDTVTTGKPLNAGDDDAEELHIAPGIAEGEVWLEYREIDGSGIAGLKFYDDISCTTEIHLSPFRHRTITPAIPFPARVFARAESVSFPNDGHEWVPRPDGERWPVWVGARQVEGDLTLRVKPPGGPAAGIEVAKMKLTIVRRIGADKFYHAAIDYIYEKNTRYCTRYITTGPNMTKSRCTVMLVSKTSLVGINAKPPFNNPGLQNIDEVIGNFIWSSNTVVMNCSFSAGGVDGDFYDKHRGTLWRGLQNFDGTCSIVSPFDGGNGVGKEDLHGYVASGSDGKIVFGFGEIPNPLLPSGVRTMQGSAGLKNGGPAEHGNPNEVGSWSGLADIKIGNEKLLVTSAADSGANYSTVQFATDLIRPQAVQNTIYWADPGGSFCYALATPGATPSQRGVLKQIASGWRHGFMGPARNQCIKTYLGFESRPPR